jgi:hypothetical protein
MEPQNLKQRPALNIITLPYLMQARVKARAAQGLDKYWNFSRCSTCHGSQCYSFYQAEPHLIDNCTCAQSGSRPATWAEAARQLLEHGTAEDFKWWDIEQPGATPFADSLQQQPAAKVLRFAPDPAIDRVLLDIDAGASTTITVVLSGQFLAYGPAVRQQTFGPEYSSEELMASVPNCLQWPAAPPEVVAWLEQRKSA